MLKRLIDWVVRVQAAGRDPGREIILCLGGCIPFLVYTDRQTAEDPDDPKK
jgi:hypothetical protein